MTTPRAVPVIVTVKPGQVRTRPELFQPRDVPGGLDHDPGKVRQLVEHWNPDEYDPVAVTRDPSDPNAYIVIAGHHRLEALKQLGAPEFAVKVLEGDISDPIERDRLRVQADLSNYAISAPGIIERVNTVRRLRSLGWDDRRIADKMRLPKFSQLEDLGYLTHMTQDVLNSIAQHRQMTPIASEIGRGVEKYGMGEETASQLYKKILEDFEKTNKVPNRYAVRGQLAAAHLRAQTRAAQPERLAGFGEDVFSSQFADDVKAEHERRKAYSETRRHLTSCQALAEELGVDIAEVQTAANTRLETLTPTEEKQAREVITGVGPGPEVVTAPTKSPGTGTDDDSLFMPFGTPQPVEQIEPLSEIAEPVPMPPKTLGQAEGSPMDSKTKAMIREWLKMHNGDVEGLARWMRDSLRVGGVKTNRKLIAEALEEPTDAAHPPTSPGKPLTEPEGLVELVTVPKREAVTPACPPVVVPVQTEQVTLGEEFHTNQPIAMPMAEKMPAFRAPITAPPPKVDPRQARFLDKALYEQNEETGRFQSVKYTGPAPAPTDPEPPLALPVGKPKKTSTKRKGKRPSIITVSRAQISYWKPRKRK